VTRKKSFGRFDAPLRNVMQDWSAISANGSTVVVSLWRDEFRGPAGAMVYEKLDTSDWRDGQSKRDFFDHLRYALDHCGGLVRVVVSVRDPANPVRAIDCYPAPNVIMRITHLDEAAGSFRLEQVVPELQAA
jgi:hypothetical protein